MSKSEWKPLAMALAWTAFILLLLTIPSNRLPSSPVSNYDKLGHAGLFFGLALLWMRALSAHSTRMIVLVLVSGLAFAPLTELYQRILPFGRQMTLYDAIADAIGFGLGTLVWIYWDQRRGRNDEQL